jgi:hypothetical protein
MGDNGCKYRFVLMIRNVVFLACLFYISANGWIMDMTYAGEKMMFDLEV